jgi:hypothetical protein
MADLTQSSARTATTAPSFYTDYLTNLATKGTAAGAAVDPSAWNPNANQTAAFTNVGANVGNYQPGLAKAGETFGRAGATDISGTAQPYLTAGTTTSGLSVADPYLTSGTSSSADLVGNYMNPYTQNVVDQIRMANQQNIAQNLSPGITAGAVGGGQFGSKRGADALALGISNANLGALGQQATALQTGYADAMKQAAQQRLNQLEAGKTAGTLQNTANANQVTAGQVAGNMATQQGQLYRDVGTAEAGLAAQEQKQGLADVEALANVGAQQQTLAQNRQLMPLDVLGKQASIMSGAQLPMTTTQTMTGSPLSMIAGLGSLGLGAFASKDGKSPVDNIANFLKGFGSGNLNTGNILPYPYNPSTNPADPNADSDPDLNGNWWDYDYSGGGMPDINWDLADGS